MHRMAPYISARMGIAFADFLFRQRPNSLTSIPDARVAQLVEHQLPKLRVAGSNPVSRSNKTTTQKYVCMSNLLSLS